MVEDTRPSDRIPGDTLRHPCPTPRIRERKAVEGTLWACRCGVVHVLRNDWNYAGDVWRWWATRLRISEEA